MSPDVALKSDRRVVASFATPLSDIRPGDIGLCKPFRPRRNRAAPDSRFRVYYFRKFLPIASPYRRPDLQKQPPTRGTIDHTIANQGRASILDFLYRLIFGVIIE